MTTLYKLTDSKGYTHNRCCKWGKGRTNAVPERDRGTALCTSQVIHAYTGSNLALLLNSIHANYDKPRLYAAEGKIVTQDWGKVGVWELTTISQLKMPKWYTNKPTRRRVQVQFSIFCAEVVLGLYEDKYPNDDRPRKAIEAAKKCLKNSLYAYAARAAADAAYAAAYAANAAADAAYAAYAAADVAYAAAYAANAAANAARAAAYAAYAAADVADAAAYAAYAAADAAGTGLDFSALADKAVEIRRLNS